MKRLTVIGGGPGGDTAAFAAARAAHQHAIARAGAVRGAENRVKRYPARQVYGLRLHNHTRC